MQPLRPFSIRLRIQSVALATAVMMLVGCSREPSDWDAAQAENSAKSYESYLHAHPGGAHAQEAQTRLELIVWERSSSLNTLQGYRDFLATFPNGSLAGKARSAAEKLEWESTQAAASTAAVTAFLAAYPNGAHASQARQLKEELEMPVVEGVLTVQMLPVSGQQLLTLERQGTVYQLLESADTKYTNLKVDSGGVLLKLGKRYKVRGPVTASMPPEFAKTPQAGSGNKPLAFIVAKELILLND